jgi:hypothetical protein
MMALQTQLCGKFSGYIPNPPALTLTRFQQTETGSMTQHESGFAQPMNARLPGQREDIDLAGANARHVQAETD